MLAQKLGAEWNQQRISTIEGKEVIEAALLEELAKAMEIPVAAIKNFDDNAAYNLICNSFTSNDTSTLNAVNINPAYNTLDEIKRLNDKNEKLYEALLKEKDEKIALLQKMVEMLEKK